MSEAVDTVGTPSNPNKELIPVVGVWRREYEEDPIGQVCDDTTLVIWAQTPCGMYVDVRLPKDSPGRSSSVPRNPSALAANGCSQSCKDLIRNQTDVLVQQKSFAGYLHYQVGDQTSSCAALSADAVLQKFASCQAPSSIDLCTCFWKRNIDLHPPTGGLDIGVCASESVAADGSVLLRETGQDGDYAEGWMRLPHTSDNKDCVYMALELEADNDVARSGYWVRVGSHFAYAIGYPADEESAKALSCPVAAVNIDKTICKNLAEAVKGCQRDEILDIVCSYVAVYGTITENNQWTIDYSTHPEIVGCLMLGADEMACSSVSVTEKVAIQDIRLSTGSLKRRWKIKEMHPEALMCKYK